MTYCRGFTACCILTLLTAGTDLFVLMIVQVHHALCEMLTAVLLPLIRSNQPQSCTGLSPTLLAEWHAVVLRLKNEVGQWVNKHTKHTNVGSWSAQGRRPRRQQPARWVYLKLF